MKETASTDLNLYLPMVNLFMHEEQSAFPYTETESTYGTPSVYSIIVV